MLFTRGTKNKRREVKRMTGKISAVENDVVDLKLVDAFGQKLLDYYHGKQVTETVERDDGHVDINVRSLKSFFSDYNDWFPATEKKAIKFVHGRVLDVGCGAGRHSLYLQGKGFDVLGIDNSPLAIKVSKLRGVNQTKVLQFELIDRLRPNKFDTILMLGHNFGLFGDSTKAQRLLKTLYRLTNQYASIVATTSNPYKTDLPCHKNYLDWNLQRGRMAGQFRIRIHHEGLVGPWFDYLFVSSTELKQIISGTGWEVERIVTERRSPSYAVVLRKS
jgi:SAM-dependent methyltransferase